MKKRISLLISMLLMILSFTGCASKETTLEYDQASVEQVTEFLISYCMSTDEATIEEWKSMTETEMELQLIQAGLPLTPESFIGAMESWQAGIEECGAYIQHGEYTYEASEDELEVSTNVLYEEREATIVFLFDDNLYLESMTVNAQLSLGEILQKAGLNTILGMGTVFAVLIFIAFIISMFKYISVIENALKNKKNKKAEDTVVKTEIVEAPMASEELCDDLELVAVIAAAIAAAEGTSTDSFVVRSIRRRPSNKW